MAVCEPNHHGTLGGKWMVGSWVNLPWEQCFLMLTLPSVLELKLACMPRHVFHQLQSLSLKGSGKEGNVANAKHQVAL